MLTYFNEKFYITNDNIFNFYHGDVLIKESYKTQSTLYYRSHTDINLIHEFYKTSAFRVCLHDDKFTA